MSEIIKKQVRAFHDMIIRPQPLILFIFLKNISDKSSQMKNDESNKNKMNAHKAIGKRYARTWKIFSVDSC